MLKIQYLDSKRIKWLKSTLWKISTQRDSLKRPFPLGAHFSAIFPALCHWSYIKGLFWPRHHDIVARGTFSWQFNHYEKTDRNCSPPLIIARTFNQNGGYKSYYPCFCAHPVFPCLSFLYDSTWTSSRKDERMLFWSAPPDLTEFQKPIRLNVRCLSDTRKHNEKTWITGWRLDKADCRIAEAAFLSKFFLAHTARFAENWMWKRVFLKKGFIVRILRCSHPCNTSILSRLSIW